jgi:hypothetical protein
MIAHMSAQASLDDTILRSNQAVGVSACGAGVVMQSTVPLQLKGAIVFQDNLSSRDGGALCLFPLPDAGGIACPNMQRVYPFMILVSGV